MSHQAHSRIIVFASQDDDLIMETTDIDFAAFLIRGLRANCENQTVHVQALIRVANQTLHYIERDVLAESSNHARSFGSLQVPLQHVGQIAGVALPEQFHRTGKWRGTIPSAFQRDACESLRNSWRSIR